jgi:hypothetical protein
MKQYTVIALILMLAATALADLEVQSYVDRSRVGTDDYIKFTIEISGTDANNVQTPALDELKGFRNLGASNGSSQSYSIVNGKMTANVSRTTTYTLQPLEAGQLILPPVSVRYKGKTYTTDPIRITVQEGSTEPAPPVQSRMRSQSPQSSDKLSDNLFIVADVSRRSVYKSQPITVDFRLYTKYDVRNLSFGEESSYTGFWKEVTYSPDHINFQRTTYKGELYNVMLLRSVTLFPTRSGELSVPSLEMLVDVMVPARSFFDFGSTKRYTIRSKAVPIKVQDIPMAGRPESFNGAVGSFRISSEVSTNQLKSGESLTYTLTIQGSGNLNNFEPPQLPQINHLRFLEPEITNDVSSGGQKGSKIIRSLVIPEEQGSYTIPAVQFSWFDPSAGRFKTASSSVHTINVSQGDALYIPSAGAQNVVRMEGADIGFIQIPATITSLHFLLDATGYWLLWGLMLLCIPASMLYANHREKMSGNIHYQRSRLANRILKKYLKQATEYAKTTDSAFYTAAQTGLLTYLADVLHIPRGSTADEIVAKLGETTNRNQLYQRVKQMVERCNQARFMPGGFAAENIASDFDLLKEIMADVARLKV